jgi:hypothetical protein
MMTPEGGAMSQLRFLIVALSVLAAIPSLACQQGPAAPNAPSAPQVTGPAAGRAPSRDVSADVVLDYRDPAHAGPGPHPTAESDDYHLSFGGIRWLSGGAVEYRLAGTEPVSGANAAILSAVATWDPFITSRTFTANAATTQVNPCTNTPNVIQWASIDGSGGIAGSASTCRDVATKEIVGFAITLDVDDDWSIGGAGTTLDVENVAAHEFGHVAGLGHDNAPASGCLTMYKFVADGEIQKRTLGLGDKLGMSRLYGSTNTAAGVCGS